MAASAPRVSAIVPTLEEAERIGPCLERLREVGVDEIVVVDAGSTDATRHTASASGADRVVVEAGGLFAQLNRGVGETDGEIVVFQYADGLLPHGAVEAMRAALDDPRVDGGAFELEFDSSDAFYRVVAWGARMRNRWLRFGPFGAQSPFFRRRAWLELGGFALDRTHADHALVRALRRRRSFRQLSLPVRSSTRRWERRGRWHTLVAHWSETLRHLVGGREGRASDGDVERLRRVR